MRKRHAVGVALVAALVLLILLLVGVFAAGRYAFPYRTLPAPKAPGQITPGPRCPHIMGGCLPRPRVALSADLAAQTQGPDLSNNDPVYGAGKWQTIARRNSFAIFKVNEGTGYIDRTASLMTAQARAAGLIVGGYDFLHVCQDDPAAEAGVFARMLVADGLTGPKTLPPTGDAEYPSSLACNGRQWINTWRGTVYRLTGRVSMIYTGAWWWQPNMGSFWPRTALAWISGYGVRYPFMPSGRSQLDIWQFADNGWNGVSAVDLNQWRDGVVSLRQAAIVPRAVVARCLGTRDRSRRCVRARVDVRRWKSALAATVKSRRQLEPWVRLDGVLRQRERFYRERLARAR